MKKQIGIIGMGYLGSRLALKIKNQYDVIGLNKSSSANITGIEHTLHDLDQKLSSHSIWSSSILVLCFPPTKVKNYADVVSKIQAKSGKKIILISSVSIYAKDQGEVDELSIPKGKQVLIDAEKELQGKPNSYVLRLGGIVGENRYPWDYLSGREVQNDEYLHLVHVNDCIQAIQWLLENNPEHRIFNILNSQRIHKSQFYSKKCIQTPSFGELLPNSKKVSNARSIEVMDLNYQHL